MVLEGRTLGDFRVRARLAAGGFGVVYDAVQESLGRDVVIKVMAPEARLRPHDVERFLREARVAASLDHPYGAHVYAAGAEADGLLWLAMEKVGGTPLDQVLAAQGPMPVPRFVPFFERLCEVVHHAHERGIVHRDIKPANVMVLARAGRLLPKLLDFGIAALRAQPEPRADAATADTAAGADDDDDDRPLDGLTQPGPLGSPHYMAPEQWSAPHEVTAAADVYALAVLAYQALTGRRPFVGDSLRALARAHAQGPAPLGPGWPAAFDDVLAQALRIDPAARLGSALALARDLRAAAGLAEDRDVGPQLPEALRRELVVAAPAPIADAVAALDAVRAPHLQRAAAAVVARTLLRYLALVAAAAGHGLADDAAAWARLLAAPRRTDADWAELGRALVATFVERPESFPIPEVVTALGDDGPRGVRAAVAATLAAATASDGLAAAIAALEQALTAARGVLAYRVVARSGDGAARWDGVSRGVRAAIDVDGLAADAVALLDADGGVRVQLAPLVVVRVPAVGVAPVLFWLDGHDDGWTRYVAWPAGYEHRVALPGAAAGAAPPPRAGAEASPFVGLASFTRDDADRFVGREAQVDAVINQLRVQPVGAVVGPSGIGKTSFVQAGVLPALPTGWRALTVRPGNRPFELLAAALAAELPDGAADRDALGRDLRAEPTALGRTLATLAGDGTIVLVVEQLEELLTLATEADRDAMAAALVAAVGQRGGRVRLLVTLRDDFLIRAQALDALWAHCVAGLTLLGPPPPGELARMIETPVVRAGYQFDDPTLLGDMVGAVAGRPGALPLLQFTAARLWDHRDRARRQLTRAAYDALGGIAGALAGHADAVVAGCTPDERRLVRAAFGQLVTSDGTRAVVARGELERMLASPRAGAVLERLIGARLLVVGEGADGADQLELIHEALLAAWPLLAAWRREDSDDLRLRDQVRIAAQQWQRRDRLAGLLWRDDALADLRRWRARATTPLTDLETAFVAASLSDDRRRRRRRRALSAGAIAVLLAGVVALLVIAAQTRRARAIAEDRLTQQYVEQGRLAGLVDDGPTAVAYLREAVRRGAADIGVSSMLARAEALVLTRRFEHTVASLVMAIAWRPDGAMFAVGESSGVVTLWQADGRRLGELRAAGTAVWGLRFSADGRLVTWHRDLAPQLWDVATRRLITVLDGLAAPGDAAGRGVNELAFSPDDRLIVAGSQTGAIGLWDGHSGARLTTLRATTPPTLVTRFDATGQRLLTADRGGLSIWELGDPRRPTLRAHQANPDGYYCASFVSGAPQLVATTVARDVHLLDADTGQVVRTLGVHRGRSCPGISPDGRLVIVVEDDNRVVARDLDGTRQWSATTDVQIFTLRVGDDRVVAGTRSGQVRVWDLHTGRRQISHQPFRQTVLTLAFAPHERAVLAGSADGTVSLLTLDGVDEQRRLPPENLAIGRFADGTLVGVNATTLWSDPPRPLPPLPPGGVQAVAFSRAGHVAIAGEDGRIRIVDARSGSVTDGPTAVVDVLAMSADGAWLAGQIAPGTIRLWDTASGRALATLQGHTARARDVVFDRAGRQLVTVSEDRTARVWSVPDGRPLVTLRGHASDVAAAAFTPTGDGVYTVSTDRTVRRWHLPDGRLLATNADHDGEVHTIDLSDDGQRVLTSGQGGVYLRTAAGTLLTRPLVTELSSLVVWLDDESFAVLDRAGDAVVVAAPVRPRAASAAVECRLAVELDPGGRPVARTPPPCP